MCGFVLTAFMDKLVYLYQDQNDSLSKKVTRYFFYFHILYFIFPFFYGDLKLFKMELCKWLIWFAIIFCVNDKLSEIVPLHLYSHCFFL